MRIYVGNCHILAPTTTLRREVIDGFVMAIRLNTWCRKFLVAFALTGVTTARLLSTKTRDTVAQLLAL